MRAVRITIRRSDLVAAAAVLVAAAVIGYRVIDTRRTGISEVSLADPLAALQQRAEAAPNDAGAWQQLGYAQFDRQDYTAAVTAYERATRINPADAVLWSSLGEARVMASESDPMPAPALEAFRKAVALDPKDPRARYFMAVQKDLVGDHKGAIADWLELLKDTPAGAPWDSELQRTIEQVGKINRIQVATDVASAIAARPSANPAPPEMDVAGPSPEQLAAAASLPPAAQQAMAEDMVARLAQKVKNNPSNVDGWIMLMRSYRTLGRDGEAKGALASALAANPAQADQLRTAAIALGLSF